MRFSLKQIFQKMDLKKHIYSLLENIADPEVPVLSVLDLGIVRDVRVSDSGVEIIITPTYSGCPAMNVIATNNRMVPNNPNT